MLNRIIDFALDNRWLTLGMLAAVIALGCYVAAGIPIDAFPDLTNNQVVVITECPGLSPAEVEQSVTFPIETAVMGLPSTQGVRSVSKLGLSMVTIIFEDHVNTWFARQMVNERVQEVRRGCLKVWSRRWAQWRLRSARSTSTPWKAISIADGSQDAARLADAVSAAHGARRERSEQLGRRNAAIHRRSGSRRPAGVMGLTIRDVFERLRDNNATSAAASSNMRLSSTRCEDWAGRRP